MYVYTEQKRATFQIPGTETGSVVVSEGSLREGSSAPPRVRPTDDDDQEDDAPALHRAPNVRRTADTLLLPSPITCPMYGLRFGYDVIEFRRDVCPSC